MNTYVVKRDGKKELLDYEKINKVLLWATKDIDDVSASDIAMNAKLHLYNKITTKEIHQVMVESAVNMITEESTNYQFVAARLLNYLLRKEVFNTFAHFPSLKEFVKTNVKRGVYDKILLSSYNDDEFAIIETFIKHDRDDKFSYAALKQMMDKYLVKERKTNTIYETPQFAYIMIACMIFAYYTKEDRLDKIKSFYDDISTHKISLPTPIVAGMRTSNRQYSSCTLIDVGDSLDSIGASNDAVIKYISKRAGIGLNFRIRAVGSKIRGGEVVHTGIIPFLKNFEKAVKSCSQGGIRGGAATFHYPFWHSEIKDLMVLRNNRGTEASRVRQADHSIQFCRLFYKRFIDNKDITLFSPSDVEDLYEVFGDNEKFEELYEKYENDKNIKKETVKARELMDLFCQERVETGRLYLMNIDNVNDNSPFLEKISQSNLCQEVNLYTHPMSHVDDGKIQEYNLIIKNQQLFEDFKLKNELLAFFNVKDGKFNLNTEHASILENENIDVLKENIDNIKKEKIELVYGKKQAEISLCVLSAINLGTIKKYEQLEGICENIIRALDYIIEYQDYSIPAAKKMLKRRSVGVGVTNFAYWLAKNNLKYDDDNTLVEVDRLFEHIQYNLIKASIKLAKEYGPCEYYKKTKWSQGILPIDRYNKNVDKLVSRELECDWESLREDLKKYGIRNTTLSAIMPVESSSLISNSTNGIEPIRDLIVTKGDKSSKKPFVVPEMLKLKNKYSFAWGFSNSAMNKIVSVIQKWVDQGISVNHYYDKKKYENNNLPLSEVVRDILEFYKFGGKQLYYSNSTDDKTDNLEELEKSLNILEENNNEDNDCTDGVCKL